MAKEDRMTTIHVPEHTTAEKLAELALRFDGVAIETHEHACASVDCDDEIEGCTMLAEVNGILWPGVVPHGPR